MLATWRVGPLVAMAAVLLACGPAVGPDVPKIKNLAALMLRTESMQIPFAATQLRSLAALTAPAFDAHLNFRELVWGTTYEWFSEQQKVVATAHPGAPSNGARLILHAIDPSTGRPFAPPVEVGYADFVTSSRAPLDPNESFHISVHEPTTTVPVADFVASPKPDVALCRCFSMTGRAEGFAGRIDFTADYAFQMDGPAPPGTLSATFSFGLDGSQFTHTGGTANHSEVAFTFDGDRYLVRVLLRPSGAFTVGANSHILVNDLIFARRDSVGTEVSDIGPNNRPLTTQELQVVQRLYDLARSLAISIDRPMMRLYYR